MTPSITRRHLLRNASIVAGASAVTSALPSALFAQSAPAAADRVAQMRAGGAAAKLTTTRLAGSIYSVIGSGGNIVVLDGPDGKLVGDSSFSTTAPQLKAALAGISAHPIKLLVNTHCHIDHVDGNQALHNDGALILAHENTRKRMSEPENMQLFNMLVPAFPADALPQITFTQEQRIDFNGETIHLGYVPPAHTDCDIYQHFTKSNVIQTGDIWFNGFYPVIDYSIKGNAGGMVNAAAKVLSVANASTIIVPGHGPVGDKAALQAYHDMLADVTDRISKLKASGKSSDEAVAAKPTAPYDAKWGHGFFTGDQFTAMVYKTV